MRVACQAMATRFELVLEGEDPARLRAAGEEALAEIQRLEAKLSFYLATSEIGRINAAAAEGPVRVDAEVFELLVRAARYHELTGGAFDVTVGPLMRCWKFAGGPGALPDPDALAEARARVGLHLVELDVGRRSVRFARPGVLVDLGAIGKGYAIEQAVAILVELGISDALVHGGTSTVHALGRPRDEGAWKVAVELPSGAGQPGPGPPAAVVELRDAALSVSAVSGKSFEAGGVEYGHVLDPRTGWPAQGAVLAAVVATSATETDAFSTALLTLGVEEHRIVTDARPEMPVLVLGGAGNTEQRPAVCRGIDLRLPEPPWRVQRLA